MAHFFASLVIGVIVFLVGRMVIKSSALYHDLDGEYDATGDTSTRKRAGNQIAILACLLLAVSIFVALLYGIFVPEGPFY